MFQEKLWNFRNMMRSSVPTKCISRIFDISDLRSFLRPPHYKSMDKKSTLLYLLWRKRFWVESYRIGQLWTIRVKNCITYPSKSHLRSPEVTNRHLPITFDQKRDRDVGLVSVRSSWPGESTDVQYDPVRSSRDLGLTWPEVKLWPYLSKSFYIWFDAP